MTTYSVKYKNDEGLVELKGHSGYADNGFDIVCASISTITIMTANLYEKLDLSYNILDLVVEEGYFRLQVKLNDKVSKGIFENLVDALDSLQEQYPKYIKRKKIGRAHV